MHRNFEDNNLLAKIQRIETILEDAKLLRPTAGVPITDADWQPDAIYEGKNAWMVSFRFRCKCDRVHPAEVIIPFNKKDGQVYQVTGKDCHEINDLVIWRKPPAQTVAND